MLLWNLSIEVRQVATSSRSFLYRACANWASSMGIMLERWLPYTVATVDRFYCISPCMGGCTWMTTHSVVMGVQTRVGVIGNCSCSTKICTSTAATFQISCNSITQPCNHPALDSTVPQWNACSYLRLKPPDCVIASHQLLKRLECN